MIRFASDGANVMFGDKNSVAARLKQDIPHLFTMKCICHFLALAASYTSKCILAEIEEMMTNIYRYLKYRCKRQGKLNDLQKLLEIPEHKVLKLFKLRWLSLSAVVDRHL